jgi:RNA polymerase sigma-70 factor (ECF subfamily)
MATESDDELLNRARAGDESGFVSLYRRMQGPIFRYVLNLTGSTAQAEDVTQEVFMALIRDSCGYNPERGTLAGYLFGVARNQVLRQLDRNRLFVESDPEEVERNNSESRFVGDPMIDLLRQEGIEVLRRAVVSLPKRYREVVVLCDLEELDYAEVATLLNCPIGTVRSRLHRARGLLMEKLQQRSDPKRDLGNWDPARSII